MSNQNPKTIWNRVGILVLLALFLWPAQRALTQTQGRQVLKGHVPQALAGSSPTGELTGQETIPVLIGLAPKNSTALAQFLKDAYDPQSPKHGRFLKKGQFAKRFGPTAADYQKVEDFAKSNGLTIVHTHASRTALLVSGNSAQIQKAFHVRLHFYKRKDGSRFFAPDGEPSLDLDVPILHLTGLDNYTLPRRVPRKPASPIARNHKALKTGTLSVLGSGPEGAFLGDDLRNAYAPNVSLSGAGQTLGLFELEGYDAADIAQYQALAGHPGNPVTAVLIDGATGIPQSGGPPPYNNDVEISMDIELALAMAPGLAQVRVYEGNPGGLVLNGFNVYPDDVMASMADEETAQEISCSYSFFSDTTTALILQQLAAQGQAFFVSSGDDGAYPVVGGLIQDEIFVASVGGTTMAMNGNGASYASESAWSGSGGGTSADMPLPFFQTGLATAANGGSSTLRNFPDVAAAAENICVVATSFTPGGNPVPGQVFDSGGTSASSPIWAGFLALVNEQRSHNGLAPVGFPDNALYAAAGGPDYAGDFHDITTGNNNNGGGPYYNAVTGYDLVTGWGSPAGQTLINDLCPNCTPAATSTATAVPTAGGPQPTPTSGPCLKLEKVVDGLGEGFLPTGLALDSSGNLYGVNESNNYLVFRLTSGGSPLSGTYGSSGTGPGQFQYPWSVAVDASGNVFVVDLNLHQVDKFTSSGDFTAAFGGGTMSYPGDIACDSSGNVFVADSVNQTVFKFNNSGALLGQISTPGTGPGQLNQPAGVGLDSSDNLYVMDIGNSRIEVFNSAGSYVTQWGSNGSGPGQFGTPAFGAINPVCLGGPGLVYAMDSGNSRVQIFTTTGTYLGQIAGYGFTEPFGLAANGSRLYVSDSRNSNLYIFDIGNCPSGPQTPPPTPTGSVTPTPVPTGANTPTVTSTPTLPCVPTGATWSPGTTSAAFLGRSDFGSAVYNSRMWIFGGETLNPPGPIYDTTSDDVWSSADGINWAEATADAGVGARIDSNLVVFDPQDGLGPRLYLIGGFNPFSTPNPNTVYNDVYTSFNGSTWTRITSNANFPARVSPACVAFNGRLWIIGGGGYNDVWSSADGIRWVQNVQHVSGMSTNVSDATVMNGQIWAVSQSNQGAVPCTLYYSQDGYSWQAQVTALQQDNFGLTAYAGELWLVGGTSGLSRFNEVWSSSDPYSWTPVTPSANFSPRGLHNGLLVFQDQMWVLGGALAPQETGGPTWFANDTWSTVCPGTGKGMRRPGAYRGGIYGEIISLQVKGKGEARNTEITVEIPKYATLVSAYPKPASANGSRLVFRRSALEPGTTQISLTLRTSRSAPLGASLVPKVVVTPLNKGTRLQVSPQEFQVLPAGRIIRPIVK